MPSGFQDRMKGKSAINTQYMSQDAQFFSNAEDNITATASGTQTTSRLLKQQQSRITTVTTAGDGLRIPPAIPGAAIVVVNDASANAANIFPSSQARHLRWLACECGGGLRSRPSH